MFAAVATNNDDNNMHTASCEDGRLSGFKTALMRCLVLLVGLATAAHGNLNLFIGTSEVKKLLGLPSELYYVRDGVVNSYALQFTVLLQAQVNDLHFVWQNVQKQPIPYSINFTVSNREALNVPKLNISKWGDVPSTLSVFRVNLQCTGLLSAEVDVNMQMNFTLNSAENVTVLNLKRRKICLKDELFLKNDSIIADPAALTSSTHVFYISVGIVVAVLVVVIIAVNVAYSRSRKARQAETISDNHSSTGFSTHSHMFLRADTPNNAGSTVSKAPSYASFRRFTPGQVVNGLRSSELTDHVAEITVERSKITLNEVLHEGTFGRIYRATYVANESEGERDVFVKTVADHASQIQVSLLVAEGMMMFRLNHKNVQPILAVCLELRKQPLLLYPYMFHGNLKRFLQKCKFSPEGHAHVILTQELVDMSVQILQGLQFLQKCKIIHRDLATRNCVVDERLSVRITDNALSRDLFPNDYHCLGDNENRPIKWLALESLIYKQFSPASDVWAFGVTLWELMTLGQQPYMEIDPFEMGAYLKDGYRLSQPINCPDELFTVMAYCWVTPPDERPTVLQLLACLQDFYKALGRYI